MKIFLPALAVLCILVATTDVAAAPLTAGDWDSLRNEVQRLRGEGEFDAARHLVESELARASEPGSSPRWILHDLEVLAASLAAIADLDPVRKYRLADAESLQAELDRCADAGDCEEGVRIAQRQLEIRREILGADHPDIAASLSELMYFQYCLGDYDEALRLIERKKDFHRTLYGELHPDVAQDLSDLGVYLTDNGRYAEAHEAYAASLAIYRQLFPGDGFWRNEKVYYTLNNLALNYFDRGFYEKGISMLREILVQEEALKGKEHPDVLLRTGNLAGQLRKVGEYAEAEELQRNVIEIHRRVSGDHHPDLGITLSNLGSTLISAQEPDEAEAVLQEALRIFRENYPGDHYDVAVTLLNLASVANMRNDFELAITRYAEALAIFENVLDADHYRIAWTKEKLGMSYLARRDVERAEGYLDAALAQFRRIYPDGHANLVDCLVERAKLLTWRGRHTEAERMLAEAASQFERIRLLAGTGTVRSTFLDSPYAILARVRLQIGDESGAWAAAELSRGRAIGDQLELASGAAGTTADSHVPASLLREIRQALDEDTALVGYLDAGPQLFLPDSLAVAWAYTVRKDGPVRWTRLCEPGQARAFRDRLRIFKGQLVGLPTPFADPADNAAECGAAFRLLVEPVLGTLTGIEHVAIIPDGQIFGIPWAALRPVGDPGAAGGMTCRYCPSGSVYAWLQGQRPPRDEPWSESRVLFVADPPHNRSQADQMAREVLQTERLAVASKPTRQATVRLPRPGELPRLPGSRREVEVCQRYFRPEATRVLLGPEASEKQIRSLLDGITGFRILHLATHAQINTERPERCALVLSQIDLPLPIDSLEDRDRLEDGRWTAAEIRDEWRLDADLVVLSGCGTALGREISGEGPVGFAQTILQAGARNLILSLWEVDDEASAILFDRFYAHLIESDADTDGGKRSSVARALRSAQRDLREYTTPEGRRPFSHPWYWAGVMLVGAG